MLKRDYRKCRLIIKRNSASFFKAFSKIKNKEKRNAIYAVYAFCRTADDLIDEQENLEALLAFEEDLKCFLQGETPRTRTFLWHALRDVFHRYDMNEQAFLDMIEGQKMDCDLNKYQTFDQLLEYCYRVASTVGLMIIPILAPHNHNKLVNCAIKLGYAMQLTNILRDVGEDLERGRVYLPQSLMNQYGYSEHDLSNHSINESFITLWEHLAINAEELYEEAFLDFHYFPKDTIQSVYLSALFYKEILNACRKADYQVFKQRNYVLKQEKIELVKQFVQKREGDEGCLMQSV